jgi:hypothetical protein
MKALASCAPKNKIWLNAIAEGFLARHRSVRFSAKQDALSRTQQSQDAAQRLK